MKTHVLAAALVAILLGACSEAPPPEGPGGKAGAPVGTAAAKSSWPFLEQSQETAVATEQLGAKNYYVVFDASGSMAERECTDGGTKLDAAKIALRSFADSVPADAKLGLLVFDGLGVHEDVKLAAQNRDRFLAQVDATRFGGGTPLSTSITQGYAALTAEGARQLGYGEYHLVVVTDGEASGGEDPTEVVDKVLGESPVVLHTIGFCIGDDHSLNQPGRVLYRSAGNLAELRQGLGDVLAEAPDFSVTDFK